MGGRHIGIWGRAKGVKRCQVASSSPCLPNLPTGEPSTFFVRNSSGPATAKDLGSTDTTLLATLRLFTLRGS